MPKMKAVQVPKAGGDLEVVERDIPKPGPGQVRIRVQACGVCHSDVITKEGLVSRHLVSSRSWTRSRRDNRPGRSWRERVGVRATGLAWVGMAGRTALVSHAGEETS